jgi:IS5 family transposase
MLKPIPVHKQGRFVLRQDLLEQLDPNNLLLRLGAKIPWGFFEREFAALYSSRGRSAKPVRLMVGLLLLKHLENLSDERLVEEWVRNPYFQAFCGAERFQWEFPCNPTDLTYFRKRIGERGVAKIFQASVQIHGKSALEKEVVVDTTVQEKNITFPTDTKLRLKVIAKCLKIARLENIKLRRSYKRELHVKLRIIRFSKNKKDKKQVKAAIRRVHTIAWALFREISRKLSTATRQNYADQLALFERVLIQQRKDKNKVYSLHEPGVLCISKGKAHKKYEFGSKAAIAMTKKSSIIVGVKSFMDNVYDGDTLQATLEQVKAATGKFPKKAFCDRGFTGRAKVGETEIVIPKPPAKNATAYLKRKTKKDFGRRSAIEPVIGHVKADFRLARCYLKGAIGDALNLFLAAAAFNFRKWIRKMGEPLFFCLVYFAFIRQTDSYNEAA